MSVESGRILGGKYRLLNPLGEGAMGTVWLARHEALSSDVAIKVIRSGVNDPSSRQRLFTEARATVSINSPHVVQVFDYGVEDEHPYIVMERLLGETLDQRMKEGPHMSAALIEKIVFQIARGLGKAHEVGLIHRDLKPANIFLVENGEDVLVKMLDFGIVKYTGGSALDLEIEATNGHDLMGSPLYMSPEQVMSRNEIDHRSDLWSLAVIAVRCMTGQWPFRGGNSAETLVKICQEDPDLTGLDRYPPALEDWARRAFRKAPAERFQSARELAEGFRLALLGQVEFSTVSQSETQPAPSSRYPKDRETQGALSSSNAPARSSGWQQLNGWIALLALGLAVFAVYQEWRWRSHETPRIASAPRSVELAEPTAQPPLATSAAATVASGGAAPALPLAPAPISNGVAGAPGGSKAPGPSLQRRTPRMSQPAVVPPKGTTEEQLLESRH
jgi:serine/threonine-protein kinase